MKGVKERAELLLNVTIASEDYTVTSPREGKPSSRDDTLTVTSPTTSYVRSISAPPTAFEFGLRCVECIALCWCVCCINGVCFLSVCCVCVCVIVDDRGVVFRGASRVYWMYQLQLITQTCLTRYSSSLDRNQKKL